MSACSLIVSVDDLTGGPERSDSGAVTPDAALDAGVDTGLDATAPTVDATASDADADTGLPPQDAGPPFCLTLDAGADTGVFCADFDDDIRGVNSFSTNSFTNASASLSEGGLSAPNGITIRLVPNGTPSSVGFLQITPTWPADAGMRRLRVQVAIRGADPYAGQTSVFLGNTTSNFYAKLQIGTIGEIKIEENYIRDGGNVNRDRNIGELADGWNTIVLSWDFVTRTSVFSINGVEKSSGPNEFRGELLTRQVRLGLMSGLAGDGGPLELQFDNFAVQWE